MTRLNTYKVKELKQMATMMGLKKYSRLRKQELIDLIEKNSGAFVHSLLDNILDEKEISNIILPYLKCTCGDFSNSLRECCVNECKKVCCQKCSDKCDYFSCPRRGEQYLCYDCCECFVKCNDCGVQYCEFKAHKLNTEICEGCDEVLCDECFICENPELMEDDDDYYDDINYYCRKCWHKVKK